MRQCLLSVVALYAILAFPEQTQAREPGELFPEIRPFKQGHLPVGEIHSIAYFLCGNPEGKPVFVQHGGPGSGSYPRLAQYFDPQKFLIVVYDQRGAGNSTPRGELRENTTQHLVEDIERLRKHLGIDGKIMLFGGSWGSALSLAYAETYPDNVSGMVLRGVFTCTQKEIDQVFGGDAMRMFFPAAVDRLEDALPDGVKLEPASMLKALKLDDPGVSRKVAEAWFRLALKVSRIHATKEQVERDFGEWDLVAPSRIDCHYTSHLCFLEEGQLLRDAYKIKHIPVTMVNGRYDILTPPLAAYRLHKLLPKSKLVMVEEAGHSESEDGITRELVKAVAEFE